MGNLYSPSPPPPPPNQGWENGAFCLLRGFILALGGGGGEWGFPVPFYSVQDCSFDAELISSRCDLGVSFLYRINTKR